MRYDYLVAIRVPDPNRAAANDLVVQATGNPADAISFGCEITDGVQTQWVAQIPMREQYFQQLDGWKAQFGGDYAIMRQWLDNEWVTFGDVYNWLAQSGFSVIEVDNGTD